MKTIIAFTLILALLTASVAMGESPREKAADKREVIQDKKDLKQADEKLAKLNRLIDNWHEAYLAGDEGKIHKYEQAIINLLIKDINASYRSVKQAEREARQSRAEIRTSHSSRVAADDRSDLEWARKLLASKQGLLYRLKQCDSFSLTYRLLADYQDVLRKEQGWAGREFAEDVRVIKNEGK